MAAEVYVITSAGGFQKIGVTNDVGFRLRNLQVGHPFALSVAAVIPALGGDAWTVERAAHKALREYRSKGEWFETSPQVAIAAVNAAVSSIAGSRQPKRPDQEIRMAELPAVSINLGNIAARAADFARAARSPSTLRSYRAAWLDFVTWCDSVGLSAMPSQPETIGLYFAARSGQLKIPTLRHRLASISVANDLAGHRVDRRHPAIADVIAGIRRQLGSRANSKTAISVEELRRMLRKLPDTVTGARDRAILLIGFAGAFRRSELTALNIADLTITSRGVAIVVRRSKTDQQGLGATIGIPRSHKTTCPVAALETWISAASITTGPLFRPVSRHGHISPLRLDDESLAMAVKLAAERIGLDPRKYAGHSLRRGFMTAASAAGADLAQIMRQSRHRSTAVAMGYVDEGRIFLNAASKAIGL